MDIPVTEQTATQLWLLIPVYSLGFGVTAEAAYRTSKVGGRSLSTELEWQLNGILNLLYFILSIWLFVIVAKVVSWWILLPSMIVAVQLGVVATQLIQRRIGTLRGLFFLVSPVNLIWCAYILWSL